MNAAVFGLGWVSLATGPWVWRCCTEFGHAFSFGCFHGFIACKTGHPFNASLKAVPYSSSVGRCWDCRGWLPYYQEEKKKRKSDDDERFWLASTVQFGPCLRRRLWQKAGSLFPCGVLLRLLGLTTVLRGRKKKRKSDDDDRFWLASTVFSPSLKWRPAPVVQDQFFASERVN